MRRARKPLKRWEIRCEEVNPDVVVVFGDDQHEQFQDDNMPTFAIYHGKSLPVVTHTARNPAAWKVG